MQFSPKVRTNLKSGLKTSPPCDTHLFIPMLLSFRQYLKLSYQLYPNIWFKSDFWLVKTHDRTLENIIFAYKWLVWFHLYWTCSWFKFLFLTIQNLILKPSLDVLLLHHALQMCYHKYYTPTQSQQIGHHKAYKNLS